MPSRMGGTQIELPPEMIGVGAKGCGWADQCDVLLALIGHGWIDAMDPKSGRSRLSNPDDFVRIEIRKALGGLTRRSGSGDPTCALANRKRFRRSASLIKASQLPTQLTRIDLIARRHGGGELLGKSLQFSLCRDHCDAKLVGINGPPCRRRRLPLVRRAEDQSRRIIPHRHPGMAIREGVPVGRPVTDRASPAGNVAEICATARLDQPPGTAVQGDASEQRHALEVDGKSGFGQIPEDHLQHSPKDCGIGEFPRRNVP